jgi:curved DNA-binding protein CbpA
MTAEGDKLDQLSYYDLLQLPETATVDDVRKAFHEFALRYHPDNFTAAPPEKQERAAQIYRRGAEAYRVLCDREQRRAYDKQRERGKLRFDPEEKSAPGTEGVGSQAMTIKSARARPFVSKATEAYKKSDWATAKLNLKLALQHEPGNPILVARLVDVEQKIAGKK